MPKNIEIFSFLDENQGITFKLLYAFNRLSNAGHLANKSTSANSYNLNRLKIIKT